MSMSKWKVNREASLAEDKVIHKKQKQKKLSFQAVPHTIIALYIQLYTQLHKNCMDHFYAALQVFF